MNLLRNLSLKSRFIIVLLPAILGLLALAIIVLKSEYHEYKLSNEINITADYLNKISVLVHEIQKERMYTTGFLKGAFTESELKNQRLIVDEKEKAVELMFPLLTSHDVDEFKKSLSIFEKLRRDVENKSDTKLILKEFMDEMDELFLAQMDRVKAFSMEGMDSKLLSVSFFETAKERAGRLRGTLTGIIASDKPISPEETMNIAILRNSIGVSLKLPSMDASKETLTGIQNVLVSADWKEVNDMVNIVLQKSPEGNFEIEAKEFSSKLTGVMEQINGYIKKELDAIQKQSREINTKVKYEMIISFAVVTFLILFITLLGIYISIDIIKSLSNVEQSLTSNADVVSSSATQLSTASQGLSSATSEQAASLTETSSAMDEINSMVQKNVESSKQTAQFAVESRNSANEGQKILQKMLQAMNEIRDTNQSFSKAVGDSNLQFAQIVQVINSIGDKAKVINDIVFQTKLLSFNASVEAARAGDHGRGFAVVAEEVGALAEMSGNAAKEITTLLANSIQKVQDITKETSQVMNTMTQLSQDKVNNGMQLANDCNDILQEISGKVEKTAELSQGIASASEEQALGVQEVMVAINSLNQVVQLNSTTAQETSSSSQELTEQADSLVSTLHTLSQVIKGKAA